jgi:NitT/TauT family transport system permease protein
MTQYQLIKRALPWAITVGFFVLWQFACVVLNIDTFILPSPVTVWRSLNQHTALIMSNSLQTLLTTLAGFAIGVGFGLALGLLVGISRLVYDGIYPVMIGFNSIPKVAIVPVLVIWFGIGTIPAILTAFASSFFPVVVNVATGLATIEPELQDVLRVLGARKWQIMVKVGIPRAMPYFFASLKVAITLAFIGSVVSETVAANSGIGWLMMMASGRFDVPLVFAGLVVVAAMGIIMYEVFAVLERRVTFWATRAQEVTN